MSGVADIWQGQTVRLRAVDARDWQTFLEMDRDADTARNVDRVRFPRSTVAVEQAVRDIALQQVNNNDDAWYFAVEDLNETMLGTLHTYDCDRRNGTFWYKLWLFDWARGHGFGRDAVRILFRYYFGELRYQKVTMEAPLYNSGSHKFHEGFGFSVEGRLRRMVYTKGQHHDLVIYGMTREEFEAREQQMAAEDEAEGTGIPAMPSGLPGEPGDHTT